jgi:hypothetical protein
MPTSDEENALVGNDSKVESKLQATVVRVSSLSTSSKAQSKVDGLAKHLPWAAALLFYSFGFALVSPSISEKPFAAWWYRFRVGNYIFMLASGLGVVTNAVNGPSMLLGCNLVAFLLYTLAATIFTTIKHLYEVSMACWRGGALVDSQSGPVARALPR